MLPRISVIPSKMIYGVIGSQGAYCKLCIVTSNLPKSRLSMKSIFALAFCNLVLITAVTNYCAQNDRANEPSLLVRLNFTRFEFEMHFRGMPYLNVKTVFPRYGHSHVKDKTVVRHGDP